MARGGGIQLVRGDPEIEQHAVHTGDAEFLESLVEVSKRRPNKPNPVAEAGEPGGTGVEGVLIEIEADQDAVGSGSLEDRLCVSTAAQGSIENDRTRLKVKEFDAFIEQDGYVVKFSGH